MPIEKTLAAKLLLKPDTKLALVNAPPGQTQPEGTRAAKASSAEAVLLYAKNVDELGAKIAAVVKAIGSDTRLWIAYPKAGKLGTDLNRDVLARRLADEGLDPCRQVAIDDTWSAMWFKKVE